VNLTRRPGGLAFRQAPPRAVGRTGRGGALLAPPQGRGCDKQENELNNGGRALCVHPELRCCFGLSLEPLEQQKNLAPNPLRRYVPAGPHQLPLLVGERYARGGRGVNGAGLVAGVGENRPAPATDETAPRTKNATPRPRLNEGAAFLRFIIFPQDAARCYTRHG